jgi:hypothetical protein
MAGQRVQVNVEVEDGAIRERVRVRDELAGTEVRIENGVVVRAEGFDDDSSGPGSANSGPGNAGEVDDDHGNDAIDDHDNDAIDDHGNDEAIDDHGGDRSGSGSGSSGGGDDPAGDDHSGRG